MKKISAVVFDRDGVLTHFLFKEAFEYFSKLIPEFTFQEGLIIWESLGKLHGFPKNPEEEMLFFGKFWQALSEHYSLSPEQLAVLHQIDYIEFIGLFPDTVPALTLCKERKLKIGVLSNFPLATLEDSLKRFKLDDYIDEALSASVIGTRKPEPEAYLTLCKKLSVIPEECIFLDDEKVCVAGANAIGMTGYHLDRNQETHDLEKRIIANLNALELIFKQNDSA